MSPQPEYLSQFKNASLTLLLGRMRAYLKLLRRKLLQEFQLAQSHHRVRVKLQHSPSQTISQPDGHIHPS